jgi:poly-gamma-glutamate capsule biosynthesis protein CapA/YwtB (metallophosphatase superfamily)
MSNQSIVLLGCGDIGPIHEPMAAYATLVKPTLAAADIRFGQAERIYSERGEFQVHGLPHGRLKPHMASVFSECGFNVISVAGNHAMDWGEVGLLDTIANLRERGIQTIGGGRNLEEARRPAIIECKGVRVAMLAYCSILSEKYEAGPNRAGVVPLRVHTYYEAHENQPGIPPRVVTVPYEEDLRAMVDDIAAAKKNAHAVVVSHHWGVHFIPRLIADYQPIVAEAAFAAGADLILGHHAHIPKAIGMHGGKACFYSLSNFIFTTRENPARAAEFAKTYGIVQDPDYPRLAFGTDSKRTLVAKALISTRGVERVSFLPAILDKQMRPEILRRGDPRFDDAVNYMDWASADFQHTFTVEGDEVVVT